ncbi:4Fe-4S dicluster domain-containing protein [Caulobacter sp. S45]|jgi:Fe-S-cluster-containing dehydrogenase component|uniref:4Fe-4S dicluster domain-containing protein n=1 Tax=Caulobacter sp. S45 TaxID=1641861 RepID=UPI00131B3C2C|nr:4Fe-4S dicluster domain-containing protein [Caulobacter sp. S45]
MSGKRFTLFEAKGRSASAPELPPRGLDRREALAMLSAGMATALSACGKPREQIVPYVEQPEGLTPGLPQRYATALTLGGYGRGVMAIAVDGRPIKIEGSPNHPYSLGSTDAFAEAEILSLYDPARAQAVFKGEEPSSWTALQTALLSRLERLKGRQGAGFTLLTGRIVSPTELRLIAALKMAYPAMAWRRYEPVNDDNARAGARLAFGRPLTVLPKLGQAQAVLCLDADPLGSGPEQIVNGRGFAEARKAGGGFARWYAAEPGWSLTGANADHRLALTPAQVGALARHVAGKLGAPTGGETLPVQAARFADACAADLIAHTGHALVLAGESQSPDIHALAHWMNSRLQAPVSALEPLDLNPDDHLASIAALAADLKTGRVDTLIVLGANPAYDAPLALGLPDAMRKAGFSVHFTAYDNETSAACQWRAPLSHALEGWGDARALDGTASLVQPLIRPLYGTKTVSECVALLAGDAAAASHDITRQTWTDKAGGDLDGFWKRALTDGVIASSAQAATPLPPARLPQMAQAAPPPSLTLCLSPDPSLYDGRYAENAWLQECPKPITSEVWGAAVAISPEDAVRLGLKDADHVRLSAEGRSVIAPVRVTPGQAQGALSAFLGGGRTRAGPIGTGVGQDFGKLRGVGGSRALAVTVEHAPGHGGAPAFQSTRLLEGDARKLSPTIDLATLAGLKSHPLDPVKTPPSMLPAAPVLATDAREPAWGMVIDAAVCIGCNACVVSCQAENNVPVVGPEEIARGRDMHWLRIDAYDVGDPHDPRPAFQPVPCMQCEHAPCEPVCPVEASSHDHEGLNAQVYNRCIGTRFCESNCPYKVRRFNFYGYAEEQAYANLGAESLKAQKNPEVTVRDRGVMEKCTYCVQRISAARKLAEKEDREIGPHEVVTACQSSCPTQAIRFGDLNDPASGLAGLREDPRHYALLGELGTRPRTTYLARLRNPNPALSEAGE